MGTSHPLVLEGHLPLATWPVLGDVSAQEAFEGGYRDHSEVLERINRIILLQCMKNVG